MGTIRTGLVYANPRFELCGVCDANIQAAERVADTYSVRCLFRSSDIIARRGFNHSNGDTRK